MRFLPQCLFILLTAAPAMVQAQTAQSSPERLPELAGSTGTATAPDGGGCATGYSGFVKSNKVPLAGVSVFVKGTNVLVVTNEVGFFVLPASVRLWPTLSVSAMGYEPVNITYKACEPIEVELKVLAGTKFKKHGRKKGWIVPPKRHK